MELTKKLTRKEKVAQGVEKIPGKRKMLVANERKEENKNIVKAMLNRLPTSTRKMRLVADQIRGQQLGKALAILALSPRAAAKPLHKLLKSTIKSWEEKKGTITDYNLLFVKSILVDGGMMIKRMRPAPQGRGYKIRKRSNHVQIILDLLPEGKA